ncbi:MAG: hypothetical protein JW929_14525 [Anaerolineales bacterium]|nr:hypothetical protein [Anaerolineales bacterium]
MKSSRGKIRSPVRREDAPHYLLLTLLSFAASITLTRLFLQLTGYPRLASGNLHIAHVLWGGLLLFAASLLPLILANRWAQTSAALLAGAGAGLFLDEVGKFITSTNDYFYPPAAPIVYVFFLLTVWIYVQFSRPSAKDPRTSLYRVLEGLEEVLDRDLDARERAELLTRLREIRAQARDPGLLHLTDGLIQFLGSDRLMISPSRPRLSRRIRALLKRFERRRLSPDTFRILLAGGLAALGAMQAVGLVRLLLALPAPARLEGILAGWVTQSYVSSLTAMYWYSARLGLEAVVGMILIVAAMMLIVRRNRLGVSLGVIGLMLSIAAVNPLVFYFDQFSTILPAAIHFLWLLLILYYQRRHST